MKVHEIKQLVVISIVSAMWLALCFVALGFIYIGIGYLFDPSGLMQFEDRWGHYHLAGRMSIPKLSVFVYGIAMFIASLPINYYWIRRRE